LVCRRDADCGDDPALRDLMRALLFWAAFCTAAILVAARILYEMRRL
jgi:hypothetical protein